MITAEKRVSSTVTLDENGNHLDKETSRPIKRRKLTIRPSDYVKAAFKANGASISEIQASAKFSEVTQARIDAYTPEYLNAVRQQDLEMLRKMKEEGRLVNSCNKFGESLLHLACRRSFTNVTQLLLDDANIDIDVRDDYHRTPLHDACWTCDPNLELVDLLIRKAPAHLVMEDVRGFTPFDYVRQDDWGKWLRFLWERKHLLKPLAKEMESKQLQLKETESKEGER